MAKTHNITVQGYDLLYLVRTRLADLTGRAVLTGYPKKSAAIADLARRIAKAVKKEESPDRVMLGVIGFILAEGINLSGRVPPSMSGDTLVLDISGDGGPGKGSSATVQLLPDALTMDPDADLMAGPATVATPWERTPPKFKSDQLTLTCPVWTDAEWIEYFDSL